MNTVIVTGGAQGIGREIVKMLANLNYNIVINYNNSEKEAIELKKELLESNCNIEIFQADISKRENVKKLVEFTINKFNNIDILINNAGIDLIKMFTDVTDKDWNNMINNNLYSVFCMSQEVVKYMINKKQGCIINISSIWGMVGASCESIYAITKERVDELTKSLANQLGPSNIRVNSIAPGIIDTRMNDNFSDEEKKEIINDIPLERIGRAIDIAKCVKWLIEDEYTTGQVISVNGGWIV